MKSVVCKRIMEENATLLGIECNRLEGFHFLDRRVVRTICRRIQVQFKILNDRCVKFLQTDVFSFVFQHKEFCKMSAQDAVLLQTCLTDGMSDSFSDVFNELVEHWKKRAELPAFTKIERAYFIQGQGFVSLQFSVNAVQRGGD